jgi:hypothetical protein
MIDYIVEVAVQEQFVQNWQDWMIEEHIPEVMNTGLFLTFNFHTIIEDNIETKFQIRYRSQSLKNFRLYQSTFAKELQLKHLELFGSVTKANRRLEIVTTLEL